MHIHTTILAATAALGLSACVVVPVTPTNGPQPANGPIVSVAPPVMSDPGNPMTQALTNRTIRSGVFSGRLLPDGSITGFHDLYGRGGTWSVDGNNLCLTFGTNTTQCGRAEFTNDALLHYTSQGLIGYDYQ